MPAYTGWNNNPFWRPPNWYGGTNPTTGQSQNWYDTPLVRDDLSPDMPRGEYERFLTEQGYGGFNRKDEWGRGQYNRADSGYQAAQLTNPNLSFRDYLDTLEGGWLDNAYAGLSAMARGDNTPGQTRRILWG
jgi:hypothetical protein